MSERKPTSLEELDEMDKKLTPEQRQAQADYYYSKFPGNRIPKPEGEKTDKETANESPEQPKKAA